MSAVEAMEREMIAQAELGHRRFCIGAHHHEDGELEYEWIEWRDAFTRLAELRGDVVPAAPKESAGPIQEGE